MIMARPPHARAAKKTTSKSRHKRPALYNRTIRAPVILEGCMGPSDKVDMFYSCWDARFLADREKETSAVANAPPPAATQSTTRRYHTHTGPRPPQHILNLDGCNMSAQSKFTAHRKAHNRTQKLKHNAFSTSGIKKIHLSGRLASTVPGPHYTDPYRMVQQPVAAVTATQPLSPAPHAPPSVYGNPLEPFSAAYVTRGAPEVPTAQNTTTSIPWPAGDSPAGASYPAWDIPGAELQHNQTKNRDNSRVAHSVHLEDGPISACLGSSNAHGHDAYIQPHPITLQSRGIHIASRDFQGGQQFRSNEYLGPAAGTVMQEETWRYPHQRFPETGTYTYHWADQRAMAMAGMSPEYETPAETWRPTNMLTNGQLGWAATATQPSQPNVAGIDGLDPARWSAEVVAHYLGLDSAGAGEDEELSTLPPVVFDNSVAYAKSSYGWY